MFEIRRKPLILIINQVGAAVLSEYGIIHTGCNVERCTFTQTTHAEQAAVDSMVKALGPVKIKAIAFVGVPEKDEIIFFPINKGLPIKMESIPVPCGHCLQIIWENCFSDPGVRIISAANDGKIIKTTIGDALPMRFGPQKLS